MSIQLTERVEKCLVLILAGSFALPLALGFALLFRPLSKRAPAWLRNRTLSGAQLKLEPVKFSRPAVLAGKYQEYLSKNYALRFVGREMMIRLINEVYLRVFHTTNAGIVVGRNLSLFETVYAEEYCLRRGDDAALAALVEDLRRMQDFCEARGTPFALVITPSKAAIQSEDLPAGWRSRYNPAPRYYDLFVSLLKAKNIRYVDGHRLTAELKRTARAPVFPLTGCHWGDPAALATANALLELLARQGLSVRPIQDFSVTNSFQPEGGDRDLGNLVNIVSPWRAAVANVAVQPSRPRRDDPPNAVFIGGSFTLRLLDFLSDSRQFSELEFHYYYALSKDCWVDGEVHAIADPAPALDFATEVFAADALVLECNEQTLDKSANHLVSFLHDALAKLPDPRAEKAPFHYESRMRYQWGELLSFAPGDRSINLAATKGFATPRGGASLTVGPVASVHFAAPAPTGDIKLEVTASAFYIGERLPEQRAAVFVNGHAVGEWTWKDTKPSPRELVIPKEYLSTGEVVLEFRVAQSISPSELKLGRDAREYGISVSRLQMRAAVP